MKRFINIFISLLMLSLTACSLFGTEELIEYGANGKVSLNLDISDFEAEKKSSRTILPAKETGSGISKYVLDGTLAGSVETYNRTWTDYEDLKNDTLEMSIGTWTFTLSVYKKEGGVDKLFATGTVVKTLTITEVHTLSFNLSFAANTLEYGSLSVKVEVPYGAAKKADVSVYNYDASNNKNEVHNKTYTISGGGAGVKSSFNIEGNNLKKDYYFIQMDFHTDDSGTPTATRMQTVKIAGGQTSKATIYYEDLNKKYVIKFHDMMKPGETCSLPYTELEYNSSTKITLPDSSSCTAAHYEFDGWYENSSYTGSAITDWEAGARTGEVNLYAKWTPKTYTVNYYDFAGGQAAGKTYSGTAMPSSLTYGTTIPKPTYDTANGALTDGNEVVFAGWYTDKDCTTKLTTCDGSFTSLYAKWNYKYVYLDPSETLTTGYDPLLGDDANRGYLPTEPLYTMEAAKLYMKGNPIGEKVYLMSRLSIAEEGTPGASGANAHLAKNNPSELTTSAYNNAILQRYNTYNAIHDSLVRIDGGNIVISNVTIDGGAVWEASGPAGVNSGIKADYAAIDGDGTRASTLLLTGNVIVQNNDTSESPYSNVYLAGGVRTSPRTPLTIDSKNVTIRNNKSKSGAGICLTSYMRNSDTVDILKLNKGCIENNYATNNGAGICIFYSSPYYANRDKMTVHIGAADGNSDGSDVVIKNNVAAGNGGGIFATYYTDVHINNVQITNNSSVYGAGIYAESVTETGYTPSVITVFNAFIERNTASQNGGGLYVEYNANGCAKYTQNFGSISYNNAVNGGGISSDATDTSVPELSDLVIKNNTASSNGGGVYVETGRFVQLEDVIVSKNKCSASGDGAGIYSVGTVKLGGEIDVSDNYRENSAVQSNIFINNNSAARYLKLISPTASVSGKTKVATIDMTSSKYPIVPYDASDSSTYVKILNEDSGAGYIASSYNLFGVEKANYKVNDAGYIVTTQPIMNPNGGVSFADDEITFELSESRIKPDEENNINVTITQFKNTASERILTNADFTDFALKVYSNGREITSTPYITVDNAAQKVTVRDVPEGQNLVIHVTMNYMGKAYGGSFNMKVSPVVIVPLANLSAYLATLPAGEHDISMDTDMSDATNVQNLVDVLKANPDVIVDLDLRGATFTEFAGVASITDAYFKDVTNLKSVSLPETVTSIDGFAFSNCTGLTSIDIPSSVTSIGGSAFSHCTGLTSIDIPSSVTSIGSSAFNFCTGLTSITIPSSVTSIGSRAFYYCTGLTSITIPSSVTSIGVNAFTFCTGLTSIELPSSVTTIESDTFRNCRGLTSITIPSSVTSLGSGVFQNCTGLISITIPSSVTSIDISAFEGCTNLTTAVFEDTASSWTINGSTFTPTNDTAANATELVTNSNKPWTKN